MEVTTAYVADLPHAGPSAGIELATDLDSFSKSFVIGAAVMKCIVDINNDDTDNVIQK